MDEPVSGTSGLQPGRHRPGKRVRRAWFAVAAFALALLLGYSLSQSQHNGPPKVDASPIPVGTHSGLTPRDVPTQDIGPDSRFTFEIEVPTSEGPTSKYWSATPGADAIYAINKSVVSLREFEATLAQMPPVAATVVSRSPGTFSKLDFEMPPPPPGK